MVIILGKELNGNASVQEIQERLDRKVNLSEVHVTLYRLEDKGHVKSHMRAATISRGGRKKRLFEIFNAMMFNIYYKITTRSIMKAKSYAFINPAEASKYD